MVLRPPSTRDAARLVRDLASESEPVAQAAIARLVLLGERALPHLSAAMAPATSDIVARRILGVLERLPPSRRALAVVDGLLTQPSLPRIEAASAVWTAWLGVTDARATAAVFDHLAARAVDVGTPGPVRAAAVRALRSLRDAPARLLASLRDDPDPDVRAALTDPPSPDGSGPDTADPLDTLADAEAVRAAVAQRGATLPLPELHRLIERLRARAESVPPPEAVPWDAARATTHLALASRGSTVALYDLREWLTRLHSAPPVSLLAALERIGDETCLVPVATAWDRVDDPWTRERLATAFAAICKRVPPARRHRVLAGLAARGHPLVPPRPATARRARPSASPGLAQPPPPPRAEPGGRTTGRTARPTGRRRGQ